MPLAVEDRMAILALVTRYNHAVDSGDVDTRAETFTEDGVWDSDTSGVISGREAIREHARTRAPHSHTWRHWTNSPIIEGDGDAATIRQYLLLLGLDGPFRPSDGRDVSRTRCGASRRAGYSRSASCACTPARTERREEPGKERRCRSPLTTASRSWT